MSNEMLIGVRLSHDYMEEILGHPVRRLNEGVTQIIRSAGVKIGVSATRGGMKWFLYQVSYDEYKSLIDPKMATYIGIKHAINWVPLVGIATSDIGNTIDYVANKYKSNYDRHAYKADLIEGFSACIQKLNNQAKLSRKKKL